MSSAVLSIAVLLLTAQPAAAVDDVCSSDDPMCLSDEVALLQSKSTVQQHMRAASSGETEVSAKPKGNVSAPDDLSQAFKKIQAADGTAGVDYQYTNLNRNRVGFAQSGSCASHSCVGEVFAQVSGQWWSGKSVCESELCPDSAPYVSKLTFGCSPTEAYVPDCCNSLLCSSSPPAPTSAPTLPPTDLPCSSWCGDDYRSGKNQGRHCAPGDMASLCGGCSFCHQGPEPTPGPTPEPTPEPTPAPTPEPTPAPPSPTSAPTPPPTDFPCKSWCDKVLAGGAIRAVVGFHAVGLILGVVVFGIGVTYSGCICSNPLVIRRINVWLSLAGLFLYMMLNSAMIPVSYDLELELGGNATSSGFLVSIMYAPVIVGSVLVRLLIKPWSQPLMRALSSICFLCFSLLTLLCALAASPPTSWGLDSEGRRVMLFASRFALGLFSCGTQWRRMMTQKMLPQGEIVGYNVKASISMALGIGLGPLVTSVTCWAYSLHDTSSRAAVPLHLLAALCFVMSSLLWVGTPRSLEMLPDASHFQVDNDNQQSDGQQQCVTLASRQHIWWGGIVIGLERAMTVSALEVATTLILEIEFDIPMSYIGVMVGVTFIICAPILIALNLLNQSQRLSPQKMLCVLIGGSMVSCVLLFKRPGRLFHPDLVPTMWPMLAADAMIFPMVYIGNGIVDGLAFEHAISGSFFSQENYLLLSNVVQSSIGRLIGPPLARYLVSVGGQDAYALFQMVVLALSFCGCLILQSSIVSAVGGDPTKCLLLSWTDLKDIGMTIQEATECCEEAFKAHGNKFTELPPKQGVHSLPNSFIHAMPAYLAKRQSAEQAPIGMKWVAGYPSNTKMGLPCIAGVVLMNHPSTGMLTAVLDAAFVTSIRTVGATCASFKKLGNAQMTSIGLVGAGIQGRWNCLGLSSCMNLQQIKVYDPRHSGEFKAMMRAHLPNVEISECDSAQKAFADVDIVIGATSRQGSDLPFLSTEWCKPGCLILPIFSGGWNRDAPLKVDKFIIDDYRQFKVLAGTWYDDSKAPYAETGEVIAGRRPGREGNETIMCINTGLALHDLATADRLLKKRHELGIGIGQTWVMQAGCPDFLPKLV